MKNCESQDKPEQGGYVDGILPRTVFPFNHHSDIPM